MIENLAQNSQSEPHRHSRIPENLSEIINTLQASFGTTTQPTNALAPSVLQSGSEDVKRNALTQTTSSSACTPQTEWDRLRAQLREKPVDADGWLKLAKLAESSNDIEKVKNTYEGMLETYPNNVRSPRVYNSFGWLLTSFAS